MFYICDLMKNLIGLIIFRSSNNCINHQK